MPYHMSSEELLRIKKGDQLFIHGKYYEVESAGHKWIRCKGLRQPINIALAHLQSTGIGTGDMHRVYRTGTLYVIEQERVAHINHVEEGLSKISYHVLDTNPELTRELRVLLRKHELIGPVRK